MHLTRTPIRCWATSLFFLAKNALLPAHLFLILARAPVRPDHPAARDVPVLGSAAPMRSCRVPPRCLLFPASKSALLN